MTEALETPITPMVSLTAKYPAYEVLMRTIEHETGKINRLHPQHVDRVNTLCMVLAQCDVSEIIVPDLLRRLRNLGPCAESHCMVSIQHAIAGLSLLLTKRMARQ